MNPRIKAIEDLRMNSHWLAIKGIKGQELGFGIDLLSVLLRWQKVRCLWKREEEERKEEIFLWAEKARLRAR